MSPITSLTINGSELNLENVEYSISISHGRASITDTSKPSTLNLTLILESTAMPSQELSDLIVLQTYNQDRFTGVISDCNLTVIEEGLARLELSAVGLMADLGLLPVVPDGWPEELNSLRATRILTAADLTDDIKTSGTLTVLPLDDGEIYSALELMESLAGDTGAAFFDTPSGGLVFQDLPARAQRFIPDVWDTLDIAWDDLDIAWDDLESPAVNPIVVIPGEGVEWAPAWSKHRGSIVNQIILGYADPVVYVIEDDSPSQLKHKLRSTKFTTQISNLTDATVRAEEILRRFSQGRWETESVNVLMHKLTLDQRALALGLRCGDRVIIEGIPRPTESINYLAICEGWRETYSVNSNGEELHYLTLALSDPTLSYATIIWDDLPEDLTWSSLPTDLIWAEIDTLESLA